MKNYVTHQLPQKDTLHRVFCKAHYQHHFIINTKVEYIHVWILTLVVRIPSIDGMLLRQNKTNPVYGRENLFCDFPVLWRDSSHLIGFVFFRKNWKKVFRLGLLQNQIYFRTTRVKDQRSWYVEFSEYFSIFWCFCSRPPMVFIPRPTPRNVRSCSECAGAILARIHNFGVILLSYRQQLRNSLHPALFISTISSTDISIILTE